VDNTQGIIAVLTISVLILTALKLLLEIIKAMIELLEKVKAHSKRQPRKHKRKK
jgi:hypothetical protein